MSALWGAWGADAFTEQVEKATSELLPVGSEDIALNLEICDQVRAKQVPAKQAIQILKRRVSHKNPNVVLLALGLTDICIKNGGDHFLQEVASREFMDNLVSVLRNPSGVNNDVKTKGLGLIQNWSQIAEAKPAQMSYITQVYKQLKYDHKMEFPPADPNAAASAALVETLTAPEWVDGEVCMRCRTAFTTFNRKHHCRNCGNVFCQQCSSHNMALPWFGIGQDVRVCDGCYARKGPPKNAAKLSRSKSASSPSSSSRQVPSGRSASSSHQRSATVGGKSKRSARQKEEDDIALAIQLSLEASGQSGSRPDAFTAPSQPSRGSVERAPNGRVLEGTDADDDPDLAAAIAASLRDWAPPAPSAPDGLNHGAGSAPASGVPAAYGTDAVQSNLPLPPSLDLAPQDVDNILTFSQTIQAQHAHNQRSGMVGAPVPQPVQALFEKASAARPRMARNLEEGHRRHNVLVTMHDKLTEAVHLYDRLLDAQMTRPAQLYPPNGYQQPNHPASAQHGYEYGYKQSRPSHRASYPQMQAVTSSLYPAAPQSHVGSNSDYASVPGQWDPQQRSQHHQQPYQQFQQEAQQYQQSQQPYGLQPPEPHHVSQPQQQQSNQQYQQYGASSTIGAYPNGAYSDPSHALSPAARTTSRQYVPYEISGAPTVHPSYSQANGAPYGASTPYAEAGAASGPRGPLSVRTEGIMGGAQSSVSAPVPAVERIAAGVETQRDDLIGTSRVSADTSASSRTEWNAVPITAIAPPSQPEGVIQAGAPDGSQHHQQQQQQPQKQLHSPASTRVASSTNQQQQPAKADTSYLPLFPVAPHPDNGFGHQQPTAEGVSPLASPYTNAPSSAGMWQSSEGKSPGVTHAPATESPLIEL